MPVYVALSQMCVSFVTLCSCWHGMSSFLISFCFHFPPIGLLEFRINCVPVLFFSRAWDLYGNQKKVSSCTVVGIANSSPADQMILFLYAVNWGLDLWCRWMVCDNLTSVSFQDSLYTFVCILSIALYTIYYWIYSGRVIRYGHMGFISVLLSPVETVQIPLIWFESCRLRVHFLNDSHGS